MAKISIENFEEVREQLLMDIKSVVEMGDILGNQVGSNRYQLCSIWIMEKEGSKRVEIVGVEDKREITAVFAVYCLPPHTREQLKDVFPTTQFPLDWHVTHSVNHWPNENTVNAYIESILPHISEEKKQLNLQANNPALVIFTG